MTMIPARAGAMTAAPGRPRRFRGGLRDRRGVSDSGPVLDRAGMEEVFRRLGDRLAKRGVVADIYVFGGAAMALAYDSRRATGDVDALFQPHGIVLEEARAVGEELGLPGLVAERAGQFLRRARRGSVSFPRVRLPRSSCLRCFA